MSSLIPPSVRMCVCWLQILWQVEASGDASRYSGSYTTAMTFVFHQRLVAGISYGYLQLGASSNLLASDFSWCV